ncbi:putative pentatricopeptide repeat-containing protein [Acorus calamus]|uniref:Pentatricopeptide repeat-containing protein n=1 Tax=Acorus calamus TaxID=4465 RepID=A0AAV9FS16_ACOCL|nr:putative pentatricopeptide repeat-containing protein [Acorus calamus]
MQRALLKTSKIKPFQTTQHRRLSVTNTTQDQTFSWTALLSGLAPQPGTTARSLPLTSRTRGSGVEPNSFTVVSFVRASTNLGSISHGRQAHALALKHGFLSNAYVLSALVSMYTKLDQSRDACDLLDEIHRPSVVAWNALISGHVQCGRSSDALVLFSVMNVRPDAYTFTAALTACAVSSFAETGMCIHCGTVKSGFATSVVVANCLIDMYGKCGRPHDAIRAFGETGVRDSVTWNSAIGAAARNGRIEEVRALLREMPAPDTISYNEVIDAVARFGDMDEALRILDEMPAPNASSWNSIIGGYVRSGRAEEALAFFKMIHSRGSFAKDDFTYSSVLSGIADASNLGWGMQVHSLLVKSGQPDSRVHIWSSLIDMYAKCGRVEEAEAVFASLKVKNLVLWNAILSGEARNGNVGKVLQLFEEMRGSVEPDHVTFVSVLSACARDGEMRRRAGGYFREMVGTYGIDPMVEHCTCMVRVLVEGGELCEAVKVACDAGFGSNGAVWRTFLGGLCGAGGDVKAAEVVAAKVIELGGDGDDYVYVLMSNAYASCGRWGEARRLREAMRGKGLCKEAGSSWIYSMVCH